MMKIDVEDSGLKDVPGYCNIGTVNQSKSVGRYGGRCG
jgi:hypothetical protein